MSDVEYRALDLVNKQIHQIKYPGGEWMNLAVITGDYGPRFKYGKPWQDHAEKP